MQKTKALVTKTLKYGDSSLIAHLYTREFGMLSFIVKGYFSNNKNSAKNRLLPLNLVEVSFRTKDKSSLINLFKSNIYTNYSKTYENPIKSLVLQYLTELLYIILKEDERNSNIFDFLQSQLNVFEEKKEDYADFHLVLLMNLTAYLGIFPNSKNSDLAFFDLKEGEFYDSKKSEYTLSEEDTKYWKKLLNESFKPESKNIFTQKTRRNLNQHILNYYTLHLTSFAKPKSIEVLQKLF